MEYYVYAYLDPRIQYEDSFLNIKFNHLPFYIGKGKNNRMFKHLHMEKNDVKSDRIKLILDSGCQPIITKLFEDLTENQAFYIESLFIDKFKLINEGGFLLNKVKPSVEKWEERKEVFKPTMPYILSDPNDIIKYPSIKYVVLDSKTFKVLGAYKSLKVLVKDTRITKDLAENLLSITTYPYNSVKGKIVIKSENLLKFVSKFGGDKIT